MAVYEVYIPPGARVEGPWPAQDVRLVADNASLIALILPMLWLLWHRLWFWLAGYLLVAFFFNALAWTDYTGIAAVLTFLPGVYIWLEGPSLIASTLEVDGWRLVDLVEADSMDSARFRWMERMADSGNTAPPAPLRQLPVTQTMDNGVRRTLDPGFGLFGSD